MYIHLFCYINYYKLQMDHDLSNTEIAPISLSNQSELP